MKLAVPKPVNDPHLLAKKNSIIAVHERLADV